MMETVIERSFRADELLRGDDGLLRAQIVLTDNEFDSLMNDFFMALGEGVLQFALSEDRSLEFMVERLNRSERMCSKVISEIAEQIFELAMNNAVVLTEHAFYKQTASRRECEYEADDDIYDDTDDFGDADDYDLSYEEEFLLEREDFF